jgi:hypothetical protein
MMELGHRETKPFRKRLGLNVEENKSKTKGVRLSGDIAQHFYHLVKERIISIHLHVLANLTQTQPNRASSCNASSSFSEKKDRELAILLPIPDHSACVLIWLYKFLT